jgi:hypothetical protein
MKNTRKRAPAEGKKEKNKKKEKQASWNGMRFISFTSVQTVLI